MYTLLFNQVPWSEVVSNIANMTDKMDNFAARCKKLPGRLKQWDAFTQLRSARAANKRLTTPNDNPVWTQAAQALQRGRQKTIFD